MFNYLKLKATLVEKGVSQKKLANDIGMDVTTLNAKMNGVRKFYVDEFVKIAKILEIDMQDFF